METVTIPERLHEKILRRCRTAYPNQERGIFGAAGDPLSPTSFRFFESNSSRLERESKRLFSQYGPYYQDHKGFVADPLELIALDRQLVAAGERMAGLFHVHIDFPAVPSRLDVDTFMRTTPTHASIWYAILSFLDPEQPDLRAFWIREGLVSEVRVVIASRGTPAHEGEAA